MNRQRTRLLAQTTIAFLLAVLLPLSFFAVVSFVNTKNDYLQRAKKQYEQQLDLACKGLDEDLEQALQARQTLAESKYFYDFYLRENPGAYHYITKEIRSLRYLFSMGADISFYSKTTGAFYGGSYLSEKSYFFQWGWTAQEGDAFLSFVQACRELAVWRVPGCVIFVLPFEQQEDAGYQSFLLYPVKDSYFQEKLLGVDFAGTEQIQLGLGDSILYQSGQALTTPGQGELLFHSTKGRITVSALVEKEGLFKAQTQIHWRYFIYSLCSIFLGFMLISFLVRRQYAPLSKLATALEQVSATRPSSAGNLLELVTGSLLKLHADNQAQQDYRKRQQRDNLLLSLLLGGFSREEEPDIRQRLAACGMEFPHDRFQCLVLEYQPENKAAEALCGRWPQVSGVVCYPYWEPSLRVCVFLLSAESSRGLEAFRLALAGQMGQAMLAEGRPVQGLNEISLSYQSARQAPHRVGESGADTRKQLRGDITALCQAIRERNNSAIRLYASNLGGRLQEADSPEGCRTAVLLLFCQLQLVLPQNPENGLYWEKLSDKLFGCSLLSPQDYAQGAEVMIRRALAELREDLQQPEKRLYSVEEITGYIYDNITESNFSVQSVAEYFGLSASNLSHYFKKRSGSTLSGFINETKLAMVKEMLEKTELPVNEVAQKAGYYHSSNFIRMFKKDTGLTPTEYRIAHKNTAP